MSSREALAGVLFPLPFLSEVGTIHDFGNTFLYGFAAFFLLAPVLPWLAMLFS